MADSFTKICFLALFVSIFSFASLAESELMHHFCSKATGNSVYTANIDRLFSYLTTNATEHDGFFNTTAGQEPNTVYGLFLCRGDVHPENCRDCINLAAAEVPGLCPNKTWAIIWHAECMLRYSNQSIFSSMAEEPGVDMWNYNDDAIELDRFNRLVATVMKNVTTRASNATKKFATEEATFTEFRTLYSLAQCTPDISGQDCYTCLQDAVADLLIDTNGNTSGFAMRPSCTAQYQTVPFYNLVSNKSKAAPPPASPPEQPLPFPPVKKGMSSPTVIKIVVPTVGFLVLSSFLCASKKLIAGRNIKDGMKARAVKSLQFDLSIVKDATDDFAETNKIGAGGFGSVYKGMFLDGQEIAVKRLSSSSDQGADEFQTEVVLVAKLQHRNLVKLLGYCLHRKERMLIYEFVPNKSLDHFIFDPEKQRQLDWSQRCKIIKGIARGLLYLHSDSRLKIIHRDLKAGNILLDEDMTPKISDFGMAKLVGENKSLQHTKRIVGTYGYMPPEYAIHGRFSDKSDVFSFGILVLEIVSGKRNTSFYHSADAQNLLTYAWRHWKNGTPMELMDSTLRDSYASNEVVRCIHIGLLCVQENPEARPTMARVVIMLSSSSVSLPLPQRTAYFFGTITEEKPSIVDYKSDQSTSMVPSSAATVNETSITDLFPR
ncbi:cysteine-rich RLK (RECEPTOR-like protein kinase) 25 [Hibiscus trionum]|uniref:Cysteine-rich RLK (RECEPTOR-like protein kinase) 25 n=1 Tax=Hibiscus trionum TaxID=183268 RepID=A0A9W7JJZ4_HIBTR|nr:cysteine-rich RLK (RECEPTOR-like protein kinase) 25 [Hibiscus trionum]